MANQVKSATIQARNASKENVMKALVYRGPGLKAIEDRLKPEIKAPGDAIVKMAAAWIPR